MTGRSRRTRPAARRAAAGRPAGTVAGGGLRAGIGLVRARVGGWFDGAGWFVGLAAVLFVFTLIMVLGELQSPDVVLWTGHRVTGTEQGGIVYYRWQGQNYSIDAPGNGSSKAVNVYLDPGNPEHALADNVYNRVAIGPLVGVPFAGGLVLLAAGLTRGYRWKRRQLREVVGSDGYGHGLDPEFVARRLREMRRDDQNAQ